MWCIFSHWPQILIKQIILFPLKLMAFISSVVLGAYIIVILCAIFSKDGYDWISYICTVDWNDFNIYQQYGDNLKFQKQKKTEIVCVHLIRFILVKTIQITSFFRRIKRSNRKASNTDVKIKYKHTHKTRQQNLGLVQSMWRTYLHTFFLFSLLVVVFCPFVPKLKLYISK